MVAGLTLGQFSARGRAEVAIFLAYRPWLLLGLVALLSRAPWHARLTGCVAAVLLASLGEALLTGLLGGDRVLEEAVRGIAAGLLLACPIDLLFLLARRVEPRFARLLGAGLGLGVLLLPATAWLYEGVALPTAPPAAPLTAGPRPRVALLTGLPILWGEGEAPTVLATGPSESYRRLSAEFRIVPIDTASAETLAGASLLLAAQPRELSAAGIDAIDAWVRMGGRALLLVDPDLRWPSNLPVGDARRPPRWATLAPLLARWGVTVEKDSERAGVVALDIPTRAAFRRIVADSPGRLRVGRGCRMDAAARAAACRVGRGRALVLADADMLDDRLWVGEGRDGVTRLTRLGDNPLLLADWLNTLASSPRRHVADSVAWTRGDGGSWVYVSALLPALATGLFGLLSWRFGSSHRRRSRTSAST